MRFTSFDFIFSKVSTIEVCKIHLLLSICNRNPMVFNFQQLQVIIYQKKFLLFSAGPFANYFVANISCRYNMWKRKFFLKFILFCDNCVKFHTKNYIIGCYWCLNTFWMWIYGGNFVPKFHSCKVCKDHTIPCFSPKYNRVSK
jgi:hypothetical protein